MEIMKYWAPGPNFSATLFATLAERNHIPCAPVSGGVLIDRDALNQTPTGFLPVWLAINRDSINNPLCTAKPTAQDLREAGWD